MKIFQKIDTTKNDAGFILPSILVISLALLTIGLSAIQSGNSIREALQEQYYNRVSQEAAQGGVIYANDCLSLNTYTQTWGPTNGLPNLTQKTDCNGANANTLTSLVNEPNLRSRFEVGDLEVRHDGAIVISSTGYAEILRSDGSVGASYSSTLKQVIDWKTYKASVSSSGAFRTCSIVTYELYCWGMNNYGQLGDGTTTDSLAPVKVVQDPGVLAGKMVTSVFSALYHNCAVANGSAYCWGNNNKGQLGDGGTSSSRSKPVKVQGALAGKTVTAIGGTSDSTCAIADGRIYCWGDNKYGTVGDGSSADRSTPSLVSETNLNNAYGAGNWTATQLSTSGSYSYNMCAVINGDAWCWGPNEVGQIGNNTVSSQHWSTALRSPTQVTKESGVLAGKTVTSISLDGFDPTAPSYRDHTHVCAVADGKAYCWGDNLSGQLGTGNTSDKSKPTAVTTTLGSQALNGKVVQDIVVGLGHTCALANSKAYCWGENAYGQIGTNSGTSYYTTPVSVFEDANGLLDKTVTAIGGGTNRGCAIADHQSYCWGANTNGQIGDGSTTNRYKPTLSTYLRPKAPSFIF